MTEFEKRAINLKLNNGQPRILMDPMIRTNGSRMQTSMRHPSATQVLHLTKYFFYSHNYNIPTLQTPQATRNVDTDTDTATSATTGSTTTDTNRKTPQLIDICEPGRDLDSCDAKDRAETSCVSDKTTRVEGLNSSNRYVSVDCIRSINDNEKLLGDANCRNLYQSINDSTCGGSEDIEKLTLFPLRYDDDFHINRATSATTTTTTNSSQSNSLETTSRIPIDHSKRASSNHQVQNQPAREKTTLIDEGAKPRSDLDHSDLTQLVRLESEQVFSRSKGWPERPRRSHRSSPTHRSLSVEQQLKQLLSLETSDEREEPTREIQIGSGEMKKGNHSYSNGGAKDTPRGSRLETFGKTAKEGHHNNQPYQRPGSSDISPDERFMIFMMASRSAATDSTVERNARILKWLNNCKSAT